MKVFNEFINENKNTSFKFKIGDYVRYGNTIFIIDYRQRRYKSDGKSYCVYGLDNEETSISLVEESELKSVPDYEVKAIKYNL